MIVALGVTITSARIGSPLFLLLRAAHTGHCHGFRPAIIGRILYGRNRAGPPIKSPIPKRRPANGNPEPLSAREIELLSLIAEGLTNQEIASRLYLSLNTVKVHTRHIFQKLGVSNKLQAVTKAQLLGLLELD